MFGKLCKYEFKSIIRTLTPIYFAVIAVSILNAFMGFGSLTQGYYDELVYEVSFGSNILSLIQSISMFTYFGILIALSVLILVVTIQRFYKGLLCDEGYLMFTLPVTPAQLIAAKGVAAFVMSLVSCLVAILSILILAAGAVGPFELFSVYLNPKNWAPFLAEITRYYPLWPTFIIEGIIFIILSGLSQLYHLYFSMALGHLSKKHRVPMSVVAYIGISIALNFIGGVGMTLLGNSSFSSVIEEYFKNLSQMEQFAGVVHWIMLIVIIYNAVKLAGFFFGTERILTKHLNLE